jgi:hypothetical protein
MSRAAKPDTVLLTAERPVIVSKRSLDDPHGCVQKARCGTPKFNTVRLSDDGTTYQGKNDRDWVVKGVKIPDQPR